MKNSWNDPYEYAQIFCERDLLLLIVDEQQYSFDRITNHPKMKVYPEDVILMAARSLDRKGLLSFYEGVEDQVFDIRYFKKVTIEGLSIYDRIKSDLQWHKHIADCERFGVHPRNVFTMPTKEG